MSDGRIRRLVSLVDRGNQDEYFYPQDATDTVFLPNFQPYHNFAQETVELPYTGAASWGQRITFTLPFPWTGDCLSWIALRITPESWLPGDVINGLLANVPYQWTYRDLSGAWTWADSLGTNAIELVEMEVNGIVVEQWSGDWMSVWQTMCLDPSRSAGWKDAVYGAGQLDDPLRTVFPTEDGSVYAYFPFWFARHRNAAFPLVSVHGEGNVRFHITLRKFADVIRKVGFRRLNDESVLGQNIDFIDNHVSIPLDYVCPVQSVVPSLKNAILVCGFVHIDGSLRSAYLHRPHEIFIEPVINIPFSEPLKYVIGPSDKDQIHVSLPLDAVNGPVRQIIWFLRRKANKYFNSWTNYGAYLEDEIIPIFKPQRPLLKKATLRVGTVVWAEQDEFWWRYRGALQNPGEIQLLNSYIYAYSFASDPTKFGPTGSVNASRADLRLDLVVDQPSGVTDREWEVQVFVLGHNWLRFQNGLAERMFTD